MQRILKSGRSPETALEAEEAGGLWQPESGDSRVAARRPRLISQLAGERGERVKSTHEEERDGRVISQLGGERSRTVISKLGGERRGKVSLVIDLHRGVEAEQEHQQQDRIVELSEGKDSTGDDGDASDVKESTTRSPEYQVLYKAKQPVTQQSADNEVSQVPPAIVVKPRGYSNFLNEEKIHKFQRFAQQKKIFHETPPLQFGFTPIKKSKREKKHFEDKSFGSNTNDKPAPYLYEDLDTLQAPGRQLSQPSPTSSISRNHRKQDRKSNLDFLGIFDTRPYFYIPTHTRSDQSKQTSEERNIFSHIVKYFDDK